MKGIIFILLLGIIVVVGCAKAPPQEPRGDECVQDADCMTGGCSGQVCTTALKAPGVVTTCEYREVYACYQEAGCGCMNGRCAWDQAKVDACAVRLGLKEV